MRLKDLQSLLEDCKPFEEPKVDLEQYTTRPHIAAHILHTIDNSFEGFDEATVVDLGCGAGALGVGAAILGARVVGVDIDPDALAIARENCEALNPWEEDLCVDFVNANVLELVPGPGRSLSGNEGTTSDGANAALSRARSKMMERRSDLNLTSSLSSAAAARRGGEAQGGHSRHEPTLWHESQGG